MNETEQDINSLLVTSTSPHIHSGSSVRTIMRDVIISLIPCSLAAVWFFGPRSLLLIAVCVGSAVGTEWVCRKMMGRENSIGDLSAIVTGLLLALCLPIGLPIWQAALGTIFAIAVAKQVFGGLGYNAFNPALVGRAFLLISFTATMTTWTPSTWLGVPVGEGAELEMSDSTTSASYGVFGNKPDPNDATTTATPLGLTKDATRFKVKASDAFDYNAKVRKNLFFGNVNGSIGETSALAILIGFAWLLFRRVVSWHTTAGYMGSMAVFALFLNWFSPLVAMPIDFHLLAGGALFGAVFMATDMVTSPVTRWGHVIFGVGCGVLTMIIRVVPSGSYPEGVTFAILIMNAFTPLINMATKYKRFGVGKKAQVKKVAV